MNRQTFGEFCKIFENLCKNAYYCMLIDAIPADVYLWLGAAMAKMIALVAKMSLPLVIPLRRIAIPHTSNATIRNASPAVGDAIMKTTVVTAATN